MNDLAIRRAVGDDAGIVSVLGTVTFYEAYFEQDTPQDMADYLHESFNLEKIRKEIADEDKTFFIIYRNGKAVGYAKLREGVKYDCIKNDNSVELQRIYLVERVYGTGIGEKLLNHCLRFAREKGFATLFLGVWQENERAVRFYEKHGFRKVGTTTFPYGDTVGTNWVMEIDL